MDERGEEVDAEIRSGASGETHRRADLQGCTGSHLEPEAAGDARDPEEGRPRRHFPRVRRGPRRGDRALVLDTRRAERESLLETRGRRCRDAIALPLLKQGRRPAARRARQRLRVAVDTTSCCVNGPNGSDAPQGATPPGQWRPPPREPRLVVRGEGVVT